MTCVSESMTLPCAIADAIEPPDCESNLSFRPQVLATLST